MKKLTKTLSLVLVVAMVLSLCVIGAGATFTDNAKISKDYSEAVTIATDLGIVSGVGNNTFAPAGTFTRAQAAVILTRLTLGANADNYVPSKVTFKDVPTSFWGYKFVEYAAASGYVAGVGNGNYSPNATLTGYQWAAMLMKVLNITVPSTGSDWQINTAKAYYGVDKFSDVTINAANITREAATQMAYDALFRATGATTGYPVTKTAADKTTKTVVGYFDSYNQAVAQAAMLDAIDSTEATYVAGATAVTVKAGTSLAGTVFGVSKNAVGAATADVYGRPSNVYTTDTKAQATAYGWSAAAYGTAAKVVAKAPVLTYTAAVTGKALKLDIANAGYTVADSDSLVVETNGVEQAPVNGKNWLDSNPTASLGGNGCLIEVYANSSKVVNKIVAVNTWIAQAVISAKDDATTTKVDERSMTLTVNGKTVTATPATTAGFDAVYTAVAAAASGAKTFALVVPTNDGTANGVALSLAIPEMKTLTATSFIANTSFVADGTTYKYSKQASTFVSDFSAHPVYFDTYGNVIMVGNTSTLANLAVVTKVGSTQDKWGNATSIAEIVTADGKAAEVTISNKDASALRNTVVYYSVASGVYTLEAVDTSTVTNSTYDGAVVGEFTAATVKTGVNLGITKGVSGIVFGADTAVDFYANAQTVFVVRSGKGTTASPYTYASYTGIANVPTMKATAAAGYVVTAASSTTAKFVYIVDASTVTTTGNTVTFVNGKYNESVTAMADGSRYSSYVAPQSVVDGKVTANVKYAAAYEAGVYTIKGTDAYGNVTLETKAGKAMTDFGAYDADGNTISISTAAGAVTYSVASDCVVYTYNTATGAVTQIALANLDAAAVSAYSAGWFTLQSDFSATGTAVVNAIYVNVTPAA